MLRTDRARGFSIIELVVTSLVFLMVFGLGMYAVTRGFRLHSEATVRQGLQREMEAIAAFLSEDGSKTNFFRTANVSRSTTGGEPRDSLAMVALSNWQGNIPLDSLGLPAWDNLVAYVCTREDQGRLLRQVVQPSTTPIRDADVVPSLNALLSASLPAGDTLINEKTLSRSVGRFTVTPRAANGLLVCELTLRNKLVSSDGLGTQDEALTGRILLAPQNTWPKIE